MADRQAGVAAVLCDCGAAGPAQRERVAAVAARLEEADRAALLVSDLCGASERRDARLLELARERPLLVLACRPRAVRWMLQAAGIDTVAIEVLDLRHDPDAAGAELAARLATLAPGRRERLASEEGWVPWFPVIDEARCQRCGQCASYCVFGVYGSRADGGVDVVRPRACKTGCPACARLCPSAAIVFPKHDEAPFDGSPIGDEEAVLARTRQYAQQVLGEDPLATLAERRRKAALLRRRPEAGGARP